MADFRAIEMTNTSPSQFSHPAWIGAVSAQVSNSPAAIQTSLPFNGYVVQRVSLPLRHFTGWHTPLTPCPLPPCEALPTLVQTRMLLNTMAIPIVLRSVPQNHVVMKLLLESAVHQKILKSWQRAGLDVSGNFENWMAENFDQKRRKELKRLKARLSEQGDLRLESLSLGGDLTQHFKAFLQLESSGWKGKRGTAIASDEGMTKALKAGLEAMHSLGNLRFWTMWLNQKPVASLFAIVSNGQAVLGKIGFDEAFAKYSPGVLLIIDATEALFADSAVSFADANAIPGHPMIDRIWRDRIPCFDVIIAGQNTSLLTFTLVATYTGMKDALRDLVKRIYLSLSGRRKS
jgi:Acetyltransferase (GNAT) domain